MNANNFSFEKLVYKVEDEDQIAQGQEDPIDIDFIKVEPKESSPIPDEDIFVQPEFIKVECPDVESPVPSPQTEDCPLENLDPITTDIQDSNNQPLSVIIIKYETGKAPKVPIRPAAVKKQNNCPNCLASADPINVSMTSDYVSLLSNCEKCKKKFLAESALAYRMKMQKEERKPYQCDICFQAFALKKPMTVHQRIHHPETVKTGKKSKHLCRVCRLTLTTKYSLKRHMLKHTGVKPYFCEVCNKKFIESSHLEKHMSIHGGKKSFLCNICNKKFWNSNNLKVHLMVHTGEKPFICNICTKKFRTNTHLKTHSMVHLKEQTFVCDICGTHRRDKVKLMEHMKIHEKEKIYSCEFCSANFKAKNELTRHLRTHSGDNETYTCDVCQENFRYKPQLHNHMKIHSGNQFACDSCEKTFNFKNSLQRHILLHHGSANN